MKLPWLVIAVVSLALAAADQAAARAKHYRSHRHRGHYAHCVERPKSFSWGFLLPGGAPASRTAARRRSIATAAMSGRTRIRTSAFSSGAIPPPAIPATSILDQNARPMQKATVSSSAVFISERGTSASASLAMAP